MSALSEPITPLPIIRQRTELAGGSLLRVLDGSGCTVRAGAGRLWITQENDPRDIVLQANEAFELDRNGVTLISALDAVDVALCAPRARELLEPSARFQLVPSAPVPAG